MKTSSSFHADSFRFKLTSETATGVFRQLPAQVSNADSKRGQLHVLKPGPYLYGQPPPRESMNKLDSSIPILRDKYTHRMRYFSACTAWAGTRDG